MALQDEFHFIDQIKPKRVSQSGLVAGIGDDAALFRPTSHMEQIICMDTMVEGVHFNSHTMNPYQIGYKALAVNISDIAAMGGIPTYYLVSIAIPKDWNEADLLSIYEGMAMLADKYAMDLIGGDTVSIAETLVITVTVLGEVETGKHFLRSQAKPGDVIFVTGTVGDSAAGLNVLLHNGIEHTLSEFDEALIRKHQYPLPRVEFGRLLSTFERVSLNDISDGLASEANEIAKASGVILQIDEDKIPFSEAILTKYRDRALEFALYGGEDFELVGTMALSDWDILQKKASERGYILSKIGTVSDGGPAVFLNRNGELQKLEMKGYNHFTK
ncbi:thiamine-phosphate kinase [Bacillus timonensis]|uniref:Thiamine-monophosphate kinase n=1 Tax=Bacillus timonensis TaxID=1033734 RepID=A0A4S3PJN9_9BACI|nr:thiamine-phosphate kinase [Bacillus timonensis]THE09631.1 thiamine-phosphate kinase [Bacillus timonensis]